MHPTFQLILTLISARVFSPTARHGFLLFYFWGMHPQAAQLLLRFCCGACRVTHLLRTLSPNTMAETATQIDDTMVSTCQTILGFPVSSQARVQVTLPLRHGGFGVIPTTVISPFAFLFQIGSLTPKADQSFSSRPLQGRFNWITWNN